MIKKEKSLLLFAITLLIMFLGVGGVLAVSSVDLKITGTIGDYTDDVRLRTDSGSGTGFDVYDMLEVSSPDSEASFYSSITGGSLAIDSWGEVARPTIGLYYDVPTGISGQVTFSWDAIGSSEDHTATFTITGEDAVNMRSGSSDLYTATSGESIYIVVAVSGYSAPAGDDDGDGGGGGGGGAPTTVTQPPIDIILGLTPDKLFLTADLVISDQFSNIVQGDKMQSSINLIPEGVDSDVNVSVTYTIKEVGTGKVFPIGKDKEIKLTGQESINEVFNTTILPVGDYILELEIKYDSDPSDATKYEFAYKSFGFKVEQKKIEVGTEGPFTGLSRYKFGLFALGFGMVILIILIILIIVVIAKTRKTKKEIRRESFNMSNMLI